MNGQAAGSEVASDGTVEVRVEVNGTAPIDRVDIIRGDRLVHSEMPDSLDASIAWTDPAPLAGEIWYYARVTQANGGFAWSTPTWVTTAEGAGERGGSAAVVRRGLAAGTGGSRTGRAGGA